jgi:glutaredoxin-like YruB-family protein
MMKTLAVLMTAAILMAAAGAALADNSHQSPLDPARATESKKYPSIVLYSVSWCPHCREAKEYLTANNIPFTNRDVEQDPAAMELLTGSYKSQGVPVLVFGSGAGEVVLKGFSPEKFQDALRRAQGKMKR